MTSSPPAAAEIQILLQHKSFYVRMFVQQIEQHFLIP